MGWPQSPDRQMKRGAVAAAPTGPIVQRALALGLYQRPEVQIEHADEDTESRLTACLPQFRGAERVNDARMTRVR